MLRRIVSGFAAIAAMLFLFVLPAAAQQRIALVIGNSAYPKGAIRTSLADGGLVAEALTSIGFEIVEGADVNQTDLRRLVRDFLAKVEAAGPGAIAFVYYSGYGLEFEGENYLIPVDARLERDSDIPIDAVRLFDLLRPLADVPGAAKIVVLDATRPLPFQIQGGKLARGLGAIATAPGMLVAFSSAPGTAARDGDAPYGAYATAIAEMVREPGLDLDTMFARIRVRTNETTNGKQIPWNVSQGLDPQLMLVPGAPAATPGAPPPRVARAAPRPMRDIGPEQAYAMAIEDDNLDGYTEFVRAYPRSAYTARVWAIIRERREALAWRRALLINSPEAYWTYLSRYPNGMYAFDAERRLRRLSAGLRPPSGFRMMDFDDVPPPLDGEPTQAYDDDYPDAPPPPRLLGAPPAFIVGLPPPSRGPGGLWRRQNNPFPAIIAPFGGPRPGFAPPGGPQGAPQFQKKGPVIVTPTPGPIPGGPPPGFKGPPPGWAKPGTGIPGPTGTPKGNPQFQKKGPVVVTPNPTVTPQGTQQFIKKGPIVGSPPVTGAPPSGFKGPPPGWAKPGTGIPGPTGAPQQQFKQATPPQTLQQPKVPTVAAPTVPTSPRVQGVPQQGQKKCLIVNGQPVCK